MAVDRNVSREKIKQELELAAPLAKTYDWQIDSNLEELKFTVKLRSRVNPQDDYIMEFLCDDYKEMPPYIEFIDPKTGERGIRRAYPKGGNGFFHSTPCICAQFNRKAYAQYGGPHSDWQIGNWVALRPEFSTLGDIIHLVQRLIDNPATYGGRMEA